MFFLLFLGGCPAKGRMLRPQYHSCLNRGRWKSHTLLQSNAGKTTSWIQTIHFIEQQISLTSGTHNWDNTPGFTHTSTVHDYRVSWQTENSQPWSMLRTKSRAGIHKGDTVVPWQRTWRQWEHVSYIVTKFKQGLNLILLSITFSLGWTKHEKTVQKHVLVYQ